MIRFLHPEVFQGNLRKKRYFEGWYFKHVSAGLDHALAFIPGISLAGEDSHAFVQVIDGVSGSTWYTRHDLQDFRWSQDRFHVSVGDSTFSREGCSVRLDRDGIQLEAELGYAGAVPFPRRLFSPGIMGPFSFIPFMECNHGVVSMNHTLSGGVTLEGNRLDFNGGKGYIEKDWGASFPEAWIWLQSNNFETSPDTSFMLSVARIPWMGKFFMGFLSFFHHRGRVYRFATYNGSKLSGVRFDGRTLTLSVKGRAGRLDITAVMNRSGELKAPASGSMRRMIKESVDSEIELMFRNADGTEIFSGNGRRAGLEIIDPIIELLGDTS